MSKQQITNAGLQYKDEVFAGVETQNITHFVFANIPNLDPNADIDPNTILPLDHIVHQHPIDRVSALDGNAVVMSCALGHEIGTFSYNWFGVVATKSDNSEILIAVVQTLTQTKTKTVGDQVGNYSVKSVVWQSQNIASGLNVTLSTLPWQINDDSEFLTRLNYIENPASLSDGFKYLLTTNDAKSMPATGNLDNGAWVLVKSVFDAAPVLNVHDALSEQFKRNQDGITDTKVNILPNDSRDIVFVWRKNSKTWEF
ncbi:phage tail protein [Pseudoalteromonas ruthenica]|uniref:phage tail-collar fiber domain-containing protein n=1 Tax=Pseudoalteromonas ruthenica TaxID=151081 RepID=UPI001487409E|nr:phage tail protein [Pseudoalteromonas ruthenica]